MRGSGCRSWNNNEDRGRGRQVMIRRLMLTEERERERERRGEGRILEQRTTRRRGNKGLFQYNVAVEWMEDLSLAISAILLNFLL